MSILGSVSTSFARLRGQNHHTSCLSATEPVLSPKTGRGSPGNRGGRTIPAWQLVLTAASTSLALLTLATVGRTRRTTPRARRVEAPPARVFTEFGRLAQELAHEIRNPLTAINARLYKLQKRLVAGTPEYRDTVIIEAEIKRLDQMLENFRKLGWTAPPQTALLCGEAVLREVCELLLPELDRQGIELRWEAAADLELRADRQQLKQVLINLVKNAAEEIAHQKGLLTLGSQGEASAQSKARGAIWLRMRRGKAQIQGQMVPSVMIEVEDSGPGIPEHVRERMFEPFFSTKEQGTGLGLPIAARIVAQHGGALEFECRSGQGSTFRVLLPEEPR